MNIIDCHANIGWDSSNLRKNYFPVEQTYRQLLKKMNDYEVTKAIVLPFPSPAGQFKKNMFWYEFENHYLMQASNFTNRLIPFPAVNPNDEKSVKNIETLATTFNIKGIKISHNIPMGFSVEKLINHRLMKIVQNNRLVVMMHMGTGKESGSSKYHETLDYGIEVARKYPDIKFVFCHLGRLHKSILDALEINNVCMDTSALSMLTYSREFIASDPFSMFKNLSPNEIIKQLVDLGYDDKIIFGSDEPYTHYEEEIGVINNADISNSSKNKIFYGNISKLLGNLGETGKEK